MLKNSAFFVAGAVTWTCICMVVVTVVPRYKKGYELMLNDLTTD